MKSASRGTPRPPYSTVDERAALARRLRGRPVEAVELGRHPAVVAGRAEVVEQSAQVELAAAERLERERVARQVLQMHVVHAVAVAGDELPDVAAGSGEVRGVRAEADGRAARQARRRGRARTECAVVAVVGGTIVPAHDAPQLLVARAPRANG